MIEKFARTFEPDFKILCEKLAKINCDFQVRRLTDKNKFSINRIIFEENI